MVSVSMSNVNVSRPIESLVTLFKPHPGLEDSSDLAGHNGSEPDTTIQAIVGEKGR